MAERKRSSDVRLARRTLLGALVAGAVQGLSRRARADEAAATTGDAGAYIGVAPGSTNKNPLPRPDSPTPKLVWTGFQPSPEGGRVFLQTTLAVQFDFKPEGKQLSLTLRDCRIHLKNNERDLDTSYFDTPVAGVKTRQRRKDVEVRIALKTPVQTSPRVDDGPDGTKFVVLEFPLTKA